MIHQQCALLFLSRNDNVLKQYLLSVHSAFGFFKCLLIITQIRHCNFLDKMQPEINEDFQV